MSTPPSPNGVLERPADPTRRNHFARNIPVYYLFYAASGFLI